MTLTFTGASDIIFVVIPFGMPEKLCHGFARAKTKLPVLNLIKTQVARYLICDTLFLLCLPNNLLFRGYLKEYIISSYLCISIRSSG